MIDPTVSAHYTGDVRALLKRLPDGCVQTCVTSVPYWGLRSYLDDDDPMKEFEIGLEDTPEEYVGIMVAVFEEVRRVLKDDGTLWLNLGDCYAGSRSGPQGETGEMADRPVSKHRGMMSRTRGSDPKNKRKGPGSNDAPNRRRHPALKYKDLVGIPWMVAFALRDVGWYLRQDNIWHKPNPMPESVTDRTTRAHEYMFHFSKSSTYYYDGDAIAEVAGDASGRAKVGNATKDEYEVADLRNKRSVWTVSGADPLKFAEEQATVWAAAAQYLRAHPRGKHSVWRVTPQPYRGAHFATFPPDLIEPCILACSRPGDLVLDPFFGSGTTGMVAEKHERRWIGFDINLKYADLAKERTAQRSLPLSR
jgi:site-specific DNA-methyltransferase (cytosine-N4-specific)